MIRAWCLPIAILGLAAIASPVLLAQQEPQRASAEASQTEEPVQPIAVADIARQSEEVANRLSEIESSLAPDADVERVASELEAASKQLSEERRAAKEPSRLSLRELEETRSRWESLQGRINGWLGTLEPRSAGLQAVLAELRRLGEVWVATERAAAGDVPRTVRANIGDVRAEIRRVEQAVQDRLDAILTLQSRIADQASVVRAERTQLDEVFGVLRSSLLSVDAPPLWSALGGSEDRASLAEEARDSWAITAASIREYAVANPSRFAGQAFVFAALLWVLIQLRRRSLTVGSELEAPAQVLSHPVANALLLTLLFTRVIHPLAPIGFYDLNRLAILMPLLVILPRLVSRSLRAPLYGLAALYVVDLLVDFLPAQAKLARLTELLLSGAALVGVLRLVRPDGGATRLELGPWWRAAIVATRFGAVLLAIAVVANLFGLIRLSSLLTGATLSSAYTAVVLFAGALMLKSLLALLLASQTFRTFQTFRSKGEYLRALGTQFLHLVALATWTTLTLSSLQLLDPLVASTRAMLAATLSLGELRISMGDVVAFAITIWLSFLVSRVARTVLEEDVLPRFELPRGVPGSVSKLAHYAIVLLGLLFALAAAGMELSRFALLAGAFGVGIGFGLQNIVNNFVSGLILLFERPIQVGDTIELQSLFGKVSRIGIRSSTVRTFEGADVILPNAQLIESQVVNWTFSDRLRRLEVKVGVAYGSRPPLVLETLLDVAKQHAEILDEPAPYVLFEGFGESSLDFVLRAWTANFDEYLRIRSDLRLRVHDALEAAGFEIPFPQRDLHVKSMPEGASRPTGGGPSLEAENEKREPDSALPRAPARARAR